MQNATLNIPNVAMMMLKMPWHVDLPLRKGMSFSSTLLNLFGLLRPNEHFECARVTDFGFELGWS